MQTLYVNDRVTLSATTRAVEIKSTPDRHHQYVEVQNTCDEAVTLIAADRPGSLHDPCGNVINVPAKTRIAIQITMPGVPFTLAANIPGAEVGSTSTNSTTSTTPTTSVTSSTRALMQLSFITISLVDRERREGSSLFLPRTLPPEAYMPSGRPLSESPPPPAASSAPSPFSPSSPPFRPSSPIVEDAEELVPAAIRLGSGDPHAFPSAVGPIEIAHESDPPPPVEDHPQENEPQQKVEREEETKLAEEGMHKGVPPKEVQTREKEEEEEGQEEEAEDQGSDLSTGSPSTLVVCVDGVAFQWHARTLSFQRLPSALTRLPSPDSDGTERSSRKRFRVEPGRKRKRFRSRFDTLEAIAEEEATPKDQWSATGTRMEENDRSILNGYERATKWGSVSNQGVRDGGSSPPPQTSHDTKNRRRHQSSSSFSSTREPRRSPSPIDEATSWFVALITLLLFLIVITTLAAWCLSSSSSSSSPSRDLHELLFSAGSSSLPPSVDSLDDPAAVDLTQ